MESAVKRILPVLILGLLVTSCAGKRFAFEYEGEPFVSPAASAEPGCSVAVVPEGAGQPGFRVTASVGAPELVARTRVEARELSNWEIHGNEPDALLLLGGALSTVAGVVVSPIWWVKGLFTGWGPPDGEEAMRQRIRDRNVSSWLFMGYLWAPVDYEVTDRRQTFLETGARSELAATQGVDVRVLDDRRREVETVTDAGGLHRPVVTDALLESSTLYVTAFCGGGSAAASIDLLPWYRQRYALTPAETEAFTTLEPARRPYLLLLPPDLRAAYLALDAARWRAVASRLSLTDAGDRDRARAALGVAPDGGQNAAAPPGDDLSALLSASRRTSPDIDTWLFAVGIEAYDQASAISYSRRSAELFTEVAMKRLGVPAENVFLLTDDGQTAIQGLNGRVYPATAASIKDQLRFLARDVGAGDRVYLYYSGHGLPSLMDKDAPYILARDQAPDFIHTDPFFRVDTLCQTLAQSRAGEIVVFLDSCFTGVSDGVSLFGNDRAATRLIPKVPAFDGTRMAVITAGGETQFSNGYAEKGHRLFSYFLMKELLNTHETLESLYGAVFRQTRAVSRTRGGTRLQEPTARGNLKMALPMR